MSDHRRVLEAALAKGAPLSMALGLAQTARTGGSNFQTYAQMARHIVKPGGGRYHVKSIGRSMREAQRRGFISIKRYYSGQKVPRARWRTPQGTTLKVLNWNPLGFRSSLNRSERRKMLRVVEVLDRKRERRQRAPEPTVGPRFAAPPPLPRELAELVGEFERTMAPRWEREHEQAAPAESHGSRTPQGPDPPE